MLEGADLSQFCEGWRRADHYLDVVEGRLRRNVLSAQLQLRLAVRHASDAHESVILDDAVSELSEALRLCTCCEYDAAEALLSYCFSRYERYANKSSAAIKAAFDESAEKVREAYRIAQDALKRIDGKRKGLSNDGDRGQLADELRRTAEFLYVWDVRLGDQRERRKSVWSSTYVWATLGAAAITTGGTMATTLRGVTAPTYQDTFAIEPPRALVLRRLNDPGQPDLAGRQLQSADLSGIDFRNANLSGASLQTANLRGANLSKADLSRVDLTNADLARADLQTSLESAVLTGARYSSDTLFLDEFDPEGHDMLRVE